MCMKWENHQTRNHHSLPSSLTSPSSFNYGHARLNFHNWSKETEASKSIKL
jgi:hypothetical protein